MRFILVTFLIQATLTTFGQNGEARTILGIEAAKVTLEKILTDTTLHIDSNRELIKDEKTAVAIAESILFSLFGQKNIEYQRPYETYKIRNYWSIEGTLPRGAVGGTFLIIIDSRDGRIISLTHEK